MASHRHRGPVLATNRYIRTKWELPRARRDWVEAPGRDMRLNRSETTQAQLSVHVCVPQGGAL